MNADPMPAAIVDRDRELRRIREQERAADPATPKPAALALDKNPRHDVSLAKLREIAILDICRREGMSASEAAALVDTKPTLDLEVSRARERHEAREASVRSRMDALGLPISPLALYEDVVARNVPAVPATKIAGAWLRQRGARRALVLLGGVGLAKTVSAGLCASQFFRWGLTVAYVEEPELVRLSERRTLKHEEQLDALLEVDLLILDELGTSRADSVAVREAVASAFNRRIGQPGAHMMMLGNLADDLPENTPDSVREKHAIDRFASSYGARLVDRLVQMGTVAHLAGESMRGRPYVSPGR